MHIHHLIWGIGLVLTCGFLGLTTSPQGMAHDGRPRASASVPGSMLDEFALALYLQDVYWAKEGRASLDAVIVAATLSLLVVLGIAPLDLHDGIDPGWVAAAVAGLNLGASVLAIIKGKPFVGLVGIFLTPVALGGAIRLARPGSEFARRHYPQASAKARRATDRDARWTARRTNWLDRLGGTPSNSP